MTSTHETRQMILSCRRATIINAFDIIAKIEQLWAAHAHETDAKHCSISREPNLSTRLMNENKKGDAKRKITNNYGKQFERAMWLVFFSFFKPASFCWIFNEHPVLNENLARAHIVFSIFFVSSIQTLSNCIYKTRRLIFHNNQLSFTSDRAKNQIKIE